MATLFEQLHPEMDTREPASSLVGQSKPSILVLLPTWNFFSFLPSATVRVLDCSSKPTTLPLIVFEGQPAKTEPAKSSDNIAVLRIFMVIISLGFEFKVSNQ